MVEILLELNYYVGYEGARCVKNERPLNFQEIILKLQEFWNLQTLTLIQKILKKKMMMSMTLLIEKFQSGLCQEAVKIAIFVKSKRTL